MSSPRDEDGDWGQWRRLVFAELQRHDKSIEEIQKQQLKIQVELKSLVVKVGFFTAGAAGMSCLASSIIASLVVWMLTK